MGFGSAMNGLTVASLNTRGVPPVCTRLAARYAAIASTFDASAIDVLCLQEVFTYYHLRLLIRGMPSFRHVIHRRSAYGPAGGLVTLSRRPVAGSAYRRFPDPASTAGLPLRARATARMKGILLTRLPEMGIVNTHPVANLDGDWSSGNRFAPIQRDQLTAIARVVRAAPLPVLVCGDFNVARESGLFRDFLAESRLHDVFEGRCPPTFHAELLGPGKSPQCIDFILATGSIRVERSEVLFADKMPLPYGMDYVSDHVGLRTVVHTDL